MKPWQKAVVGIALIVIPGTLVIGAGVGLYKLIDNARKKKKLKESSELEKEVKNG